MINKPKIPALTAPRKTLVLLYIIALILVSSGLAAQEKVVFRVHMEHAYVNPDDRIFVRGASPLLGNWTETSGLELSPSTENEAVFTGSIPAGSIPETGLEYKFVIQSAIGELRWEHRGNRSIKPGESPALVWFDDRSTPGIQQTFVTLTVRLDLSDYFINGSPVEGVQLMGGRAPLTFDEEKGGVEMSQVSDQVWETQVSFPYGTQKDIPFKFRWKYLDEWHWEYRPGHINHVLWVNDNNPQESIALAFDSEQGKIIPAAPHAEKVDNYTLVLANLGGELSGNRYYYEEAITHLLEGRLVQAQSSYDLYSAGTSSKSEIDDFQYLMAGKIAEEQGMDAAQRYINQQQRSETNQHRKAHFEYLKGEILLNAGRQAEARGHFQKVQNDFPLEQDITEYSENGLVVSYLMEGDSVSLENAKNLLEPYKQSEHTGKLKQLERLYGMMGDEYLQREMLVRLTQVGNEKQRIQSQIKLADFDIKNERFEESLTLLNSLPPAASLTQQKEWNALKIEVLTKLGYREQLVDEVELFEQKWPNDARLNQFRKDKNQAKEKIDKKKALKAGANEEGQ